MFNSESRRGPALAAAPSSEHGHQGQREAEPRHGVAEVVVGDGRSGSGRRAAIRSAFGAGSRSIQKGAARSRPRAAAIAREVAGEPAVGAGLVLGHEQAARLGRAHEAGERDLAGRRGSLRRAGSRSSVGTKPRLTRTMAPLAQPQRREEIIALDGRSRAATTSARARRPRGRAGRSRSGARGGTRRPRPASRASAPPARSRPGAARARVSIRAIRSLLPRLALELPEAERRPGSRERVEGRKAGREERRGSGPASPLQPALFGLVVILEGDHEALGRAHQGEAQRRSRGPTTARCAARAAARR